VQHVVVVVPVDPEIDEAEDVRENAGSVPRSAAKSVACGGLSSSTMIVMRIAITPSLNASSLVLLMPKIQTVEVDGQAPEHR
jgi:hypothetical protein